jgi:ribosome biogenesis protein MAK21
MFIGLLLRAMKSDVNLKRVAAFAKRVLQVSNELHSCSAWTRF